MKVAKAASKLPEPGRSTGLESEIDAKSMQFQRLGLGAEAHAVEQKPIKNPKIVAKSPGKSRGHSPPVPGDGRVTRMSELIALNASWRIVMCRPAPGGGVGQHVRSSISRRSVVTFRD